VDFVIETSRRRAGEPAEIIAIEVKRAEKWSREWEGPLRSLDKFQGIKPEKRIGEFCAGDGRSGLMADFIPEPQPWDQSEMAVMGHEDRACFQGVGRDPDIIDRNRGSGLSKRGHD
jgi:hypothetical protein